MESIGGPVAAADCAELAEALLEYVGRAGGAVMTLVRSACASQTPDDDVLRQQVDFYGERIVVAAKMKKLLQARLYLARALREARARPASHGDLTKLELGLSEATDAFLKLAVERQLLNAVLQKSIQSTILYTVDKNVFAHADLNAIEANVAQQMRRMVGASRRLRSLVESAEGQCAEAEARRRQLATEFGAHARKLRPAARPFADAQLTASVRKKIKNINLLSSFMSTLVAANAERPRVAELALVVAKWRQRRSFAYYEAKCTRS